MHAKLHWLCSSEIAFQATLTDQLWLYIQPWPRGLNFNVQFLLWHRSWSVFWLTDGQRIYAFITIPLLYRFSTLLKFLVFKCVSAAWLLKMPTLDLLFFAFWRKWSVSSGLQFSRSSKYSEAALPNHNHQASCAVLGMTYKHVLVKPLKPPR